MVVMVTSLSIVVLTAVKGGRVSVCDRMNGEEKRGGEGPIPVR